MTVFAGLDVHKKYFHATAMDKSGDILVQEEFPNETEGYDSLLAMTGEEVKVAFEATYAWEYVYEELEDRVKEVKLAHPKRTEVITKEKIKTDVKASEALANLLRTSWLPEAWIPPKETRKLREKLRRRAYLVWKRTGFKNKIKVDLAKHGIRRDFFYSEEDKKIYEDAKKLEDTGVFSIVLESIPSELGREITEKVDIPTIGIGAGPHCNGQVLVFHDLLGWTEFSPKFLKEYADLISTIKDAVKEFREEVKSEDFPTLDHSYEMSENFKDELTEYLEENP